MEANARERLYRLVEQIPEDDEPVTPEQEEAVREAIENVAAGRVHSLEEVKQELGLG